MRRYLSILLMPFLIFATLAGCASKYGNPNTQVNYYPKCYQPIADLRQRENQVGKSTLGGAVIGALGGALLGLLTGDGRWQGALMGAAVGGVSGSMVGHAYGTREKELDDNRRMAAYLENLDGDIYNMDISAAAAQTSLNCYDQQFQVLLAAIRAKKIDRQSAAARFAEIQSGREEAIAILGDVARAGTNLEQQYKEAFILEEQEMQMQPQGSPARTASKKQTLNAARKKQQTLAKKTSHANQKRSEAQTTTAQQSRAINEAMAGLEELKI